MLGSGKNMFRWLECQLALNKLSTVKDIRRALSVLPHTLFESYDRLLESIDETCTNLVIAALYLIIHSLEPLTLVKIVQGIAPIDDRGYIDYTATFMKPRRLLKQCRALLMESERQEWPGDYKPSKEEKKMDLRIRLCHYTVQEYLTSDHLKMHKTLSKYFIEPRESQSGKTDMTVRVMKHLLAVDSSRPCDTEDDATNRFEKHRFYVYCAVNWSLHLREIT
ncbi:hypothetical protein FPQ18DRAFT_39445 [Pyronema domesticum]|nr:hypothetical protein FPQ18DRAFT_39445 [Pyronema domesticum]